MAIHLQQRKRKVQFGEDENQLTNLFGTARTAVGAVIPGVGALTGLSTGAQSIIRAEDESGVARSPERAVGASLFDPAGTVLKALESGNEEAIIAALVTGGPASAGILQKEGVRREERIKTTEEFQAEQAAKFSGEDLFTNPSPIVFRHGGELTSAKARKILRDGTVRGNPLTDKQRRFFGAHARFGLEQFPHGGDLEGYKFKHGTGSFIKPGRKGIFTAKAQAAGRSVQEHAKHVMANKDDFDIETVRQANFAKQAGRGFKKAQQGINDINLPPGVDATPNDIDRAIAIAGGAIEVEKGEIVLKRTEEGRYIEVADFKDAPTHIDGGRVFVPTEGDIIFPANKRKVIKEFLKKKDFQSIDSARLSLPKSGSTKARFGMIHNTSPFTKTNFKAQAGFDDDLFLTEEPFPGPGAVEADLDPSLSFFGAPDVQNATLLAQQPQLIQTTTFDPEFTTVPRETDTREPRGFDARKAVSTASNLAALAPAFSNLIEGLTSRAKVTQPVFNPLGERAIQTLEDITLDFRPGIQDIERSEAASFEKARNLAAGNTSVLLGNIGNIRSQTLREKNRLRTQKSNVENEAKRQLAETLQQLGSERARAILFAEESTEAAQARKREFRRTGLSQVSEAIQRQQLQKNRELRDEEKLEILKAAFPDLANVLD